MYQHVHITCPMATDLKGTSHESQLPVKGLLSYSRLLYFQPANGVHGPGGGRSLWVQHLDQNMWWQGMITIKRIHIYVIIIWTMVVSILNPFTGKCPQCNRRKAQSRENCLNRRPRMIGWSSSHARCDWLRAPGDLRWVGAGMKPTTDIAFCGAKYSLLHRCSSIGLVVAVRLILASIISFLCKVLTYVPWSRVEGR